MNELEKITLSFDPPTQEERQEIETVAKDIFARTMAQNFGLISATPSFYATLAEEAYEAARVFVKESKFQLTKYEQFATPKTTAKKETA